MDSRLKNLDCAEAACNAWSCESHGRYWLNAVAEEQPRVIKGSDLVAQKGRPSRRTCFLGISETSGRKLRLLVRVFGVFGLSVRGNRADGLSGVRLVGGCLCTVDDGGLRVLRNTARGFRKARIWRLLPKGFRTTLKNDGTDCLLGDVTR